MNFLQPSSYSLSELIDNWKLKYPQSEIIPNTIFNLASNNKLILHTNKISWPYKIWCYREIFIDELIGFSIKLDLSLVETGELSIYDAQITNYYDELTSDEVNILSNELERLLDNEAVHEEKSKKKVKWAQLENYVKGHVTNDDFLTFNIDFFERVKGDPLFKGFYCLENIESLSANFKTIKMEFLDGYESDAKTYIADKFNIPIYEYISKETDSIKRLKKSGTLTMWSEEEIESGFNCPLEYPEQQVQIDEYTKIDESDIYILRADKEQAEKFLNKLIKEDHQNEEKKQQGEKISKINQDRIIELDNYVEYISNRLKKDGFKLPVNNKGKEVIPLTGEEALAVLYKRNEVIFKKIKNSSIRGKEFWKKYQNKYELAKNRELQKEFYKKIQKLILSY
ncbi:MAG: hypothetical protein KZQ83_12890 [gamma proteobacterium symbiont of Taylorina sp.]|nr:hypothetical protein [gamma proteobacterium symbiont of Taylorina sp.]